MPSLKYSFVFFLSAASVVLATPAQIEQQLGVVSTRAAKWDALLTAFPTTGGSVSDVMEIHTAGQSFFESLATVGELTAANGPLSAADASAILAVTAPCEQSFLNSMSVIAAKKPLFMATIEAMILSDLRTLNATSIGFSNSFIRMVPASDDAMVAASKSTEAAAASALAAAIIAYS